MTQPIQRMKPVEIYPSEKPYKPRTAIFMQESDKATKQRTSAQNRALHKGCEEIASLLIEHGISLSVALKNLDVRPTMNTIKDAYRSIATAKYGVESTADLSTAQINEVWVDLVKALEETTGVTIPFPSQEALIDYEADM